MINRVIALVAGMLFGMGMVISQMVDPAKVIGFLNITGNWDPSLALVMGGALMVFAPAYRFLIKPRNKAISGEALKVPTNKQIDAPLVFGAALFGIGWGAAGICPGPALTALVSGQKEIIFFIAAMALGQVVVLIWQRARLARLQQA
ncbi:YeeE/YedE family protein [Motilimonas eburnea]|uniref:YeeE/YedE family protein n=1 Tax=Motilimonas eburnea TaxID=1737488 RepID=UPI001E3F81DB|nr:YeeE/YedE family protein [Motilimonas eburnea]MCE2573431.1 YeeE/YedE family protein [Motilimonas eburnea]